MFLERRVRAFLGYMSFFLFFNRLFLVFIKLDFLGPGVLVYAFYEDHKMAFGLFLAIRFHSLNWVFKFIWIYSL